MGAEAQSLPQTAGPPKRRLRNYLLDARFQLKYTLMVVAVTVVVASILGFFAYRYSTGMTESLNAQMLAQPDLDPALVHDLQRAADEEDMRVLIYIVSGILFLAVVLGLTGIVVTHKLVGPAYKLKRLFGEISDGHLRVVGKLRKGDELQDVFEAFERMVSTLRKRQEDEIAHLDQVLESARGDGGAPGDPAKVVDTMVELRERMKKELE